MVFLVDILHLIDRVWIRRILLQPTLHCVLGPFDLYFVDVVEGVFPDSERHHNLLTSSDGAQSRERPLRLHQRSKDRTVQARNEASATGVHAESKLYRQDGEY